MFRTTKIMKTSLYMQPILVKLSLFVIELKLNDMSLTNQEKLNSLGINIWRKRSDFYNKEVETEIYSIDDEYLFVLGEKDKNESEEHKTLFFNSLAKSIGMNSSKKDTSPHNLDKISKVFLLDSQLPEILSEFQGSKITLTKSLNEICNSKENKKAFLELF